MKAYDGMADLVLRGRHLNLTAGLITTITQFCKIPEKMEGHRAASIEFGKFARNIAVEVSLPTEQRSKAGHIFVADCREETDKLMERCPGIPTTLVKTFGSRFRKGEFMKPDIHFICNCLRRFFL